MNQGLALLRPNYRRLSEDQPYGTPHSCFQLCQALAQTGRYSHTDIFDESLNFRGVAYPFKSSGKFRGLDEFALYLDDYRCVYLSNDLMHYVSHNFRLDHQCVPLVAEIGTAHHDEQWKNIFLAGIAGKIAAYDGFIFKSKRAQSLFEKTTAYWRQQFGLHINAQTCYLPNGIDTADNQRSAYLRQICRDQLMYRDEDVVFLAFNRVAPTTKLDYESLIWNWRHVVQRNANAKLLIAGAKVSAPDYRDYPLFLRNLARKAGVAQYVCILENPYEIFAHARNALMSAADVFLHTAKGMQETSSLTILEAMSHALPVIVSDWSGAAEIVERGGDGLVVGTVSAQLPSDLEHTALTRSNAFYNGALEESVACDAQEIAHAVLTLAGNAQLRQTMGARARTNVEAHYTLASVAQKRIDFFEQCTAMAQAAASSESRASKKIILPDMMVHAMGSQRLLPSTPIALGADDGCWLEIPRWAEHSELSLQVIEALKATGAMTAGAVFAHIFGEQCKSGSEEWAVFSSILIKMASINLLRCVAPAAPL